MLSEHKLEVLRAVEASELPVRKVLDQLEIPCSTYYRWRHSFRQRGLAGLRDRPPGPRRVWNQILPQERDRILETALLFPERSPREVSCQVTDTCGFTVSESSVYRILKAEGLIREVQLRGFPAESEYLIKTTGINQQWQTDATYLLVKNWGWYYLISVLDDFSRRILAWGLQPSMCAGDFSQVVEAACEGTGVDQAPVSHRPRLVTDRGPALISKDFGQYLETKGLGISWPHPIIPRPTGRSNATIVPARNGSTSLSGRHPGSWSGRSPSSSTTTTPGATTRAWATSHPMMFTLEDEILSTQKGGDYKELRLPVGRPSMLN